MIKPINMFSSMTKTFQQNPITRPMTLKTPEIQPDSFQKTSQVAFTGRKEDTIRDLGNIECPCCGDKMLTDKDFKKIRNGLRESGNSAKAVQVLTPYEEYMHDTEKECFNILKEESKKKPNSNFQQIFRDNREIHLKKLKEKENIVLDDVDTIAQALKEEEKAKIKKATEDTRKMLDSTNEKDIKFKRKAFISSIEDLESSIRDKETFTKIKQASKKMPSSSNDVNAFVIKYSDRNHQEIGERLVKLSVGTIEHIHPQSKGGGDKLSNYLLECGDCNHNRSSIPLDEWITEEHPEMVENTKKYLETVENLVKSGEHEELEGYSEAVARTLLFESNGLINVEEDDKAPKKKENEDSKNGFGTLTGAVK